MCSVNCAGSTPFFSSAAMIIARLTGCGALQTLIRYVSLSNGRSKACSRSSSESTREPGAADFARHQRIVGVVAVGGRQVVLEDQPLQALIEHVARALRPLDAAAEAGDLGHRPELRAMAVGARAARVGVLARETEVPLIVEARPLRGRAACTAACTGHLSACVRKGSRRSGCASTNGPRVSSRHCCCLARRAARDSSRLIYSSSEAGRVTARNRRRCKGRPSYRFLLTGETYGAYRPRKLAASSPGLRATRGAARSKPTLTHPATRRQLERALHSPGAAPAAGQQRARR